MGFLFKIAAVSQNILLGNSQTCFPAWDFWTWEKLKPFYNAGGIAWDAEQPGNRAPECTSAEWVERRQLRKVPRLCRANEVSSAPLSC